jgi:hypothetical protein
MSLGSRRLPISALVSLLLLGSNGPATAGEQIPSVEHSRGLSPAHGATVSVADRLLALLPSDMFGMRAPRRTGPVLPRHDADPADVRTDGCVLRAEPGAEVGSYTLRLEAAGSLGHESSLSFTFMVRDAHGEAIQTLSSGAEGAGWQCPSLTGTYTAHASITRGDDTDTCTATVHCEVPLIVCLPPRCHLAVSPEEVAAGSPILIDATRAWSQTHCFSSNRIVVTRQDETLLDTDGAQHIRYVVPEAGELVIVNTVTDCSGQVTICEMRVSSH